ncbi:MAG TPA: xanthine dehydrogenase family protein subunit M [Verrucomicrobiae bacterium]|jgi:carbon-monoxide dehydrogenase medium subunit|nr:xanthine dehydrogenase family protein subunit M [Verrucomicrobiae bacterium]
MYPRAFAYHRAKSYPEAISLLGELGEDAKFLAGGQSLIPLMKLRLSTPAHLVDLNFVPETSYIRSDGSLRFGAMTRHSEIAACADVERIPILRDCAAGIADPQVRHMGTIGGSIAEADPTGDWAPVLQATGATVKTLSANGERRLDISAFILDAYTTALLPAELITEISIPVPQSRSGGAYIALKRCAPVYASASVAVQLTLNEDHTCQQARMYLGVLGLTATRITAAEELLRGQAIGDHQMEGVREAVMDVAEPMSDMRGSAEYKRHAAGALAKLALDAGLRRARGEHVEVTHLYA